MEFEFRSDGRLRYANNSNYKNDIMIRKEGASTRRRAHSCGGCYVNAADPRHPSFAPRRAAQRA